MYLHLSKDVTTDSDLLIVGASFARDLLIVGASFARDLFFVGASFARDLLPKRGKRNIAKDVYFRRDRYSDSA